MQATVVGWAVRKMVGSVKQFLFKATGRAHPTKHKLEEISIGYRHWAE